MAFAVEPYIFDWIFFDDSSLSKRGSFSCGLFRETHKKSDNLSIIAVRWAENESLSICSLLCISSNYLCPVLYSQFEGHLGCFKVSFSSPTFAIQTSELQLLTTNLRIIFELTKSKRDASICSHLSTVYWTLALAFALLLRLWAIRFCSISSLLLIVWARRQRLISAIW